MAPLFLIVPLMVSAVLPADAFAGEKERKTLESLLHSSIGDRDLFVAKFLTAFLPAITVSWLGFLAFAVAMAIGGVIWAFALLLLRGGVKRFTRDALGPRSERTGTTGARSPF